MFLPNWIKRRIVLTVLLVAILGLLTRYAPHAAITAAAQGESGAGNETLSILQKNQIPPRDPVDLAKRLLGVATIPPTPNAPKAYQIGDEQEFTAVNSTDNVDFKVTAKLWYATPHVYMWFEKGYEPDLEGVKQSADTFENHIYPTVHSYFGMEQSPGVDNDVHLYVLNVHKLGNGIAGLFDSRSQYPAVVVPGSNEHQMFSMSLDTFGSGVGSPAYNGVLAHEFQHMVHANVDPNEEGWVDEGLAELSEQLNGYPNDGFFSTFLSIPDTQLNTWSYDNSTPHYGASYAFMNYYLQRFGEDALRKLVANQANGLEGFRSTLEQIGAKDTQTGNPITVEDFFADWVIANALNDPKVGDGRYGYDTFRGTLPTPSMQTMSVGQSITLKTSQWGTTYLVLDQPGTYQFKFTGQPTVKVLPTDASGGKKAWWSTSSDRSDTRLTREFDLTKVTKATLNFDLWYTTEKDWDYGYVMASTDGGNTWKALSTQDTIANGHNNPYGAAFNAYSGSETVEGARWRKETADLTPYTGKKVMLRFEYLTDDAFTLRGMFLDNISIPEIQYSTDAEADDGGWKAEGWVRVENVLPQRYLVQEIDEGAVPHITRIIGPDDSAAEKQWKFTVDSNTPKVVIAVSGLTEFTTEPAPFTYTLTKSE